MLSKDIITSKNEKQEHRTKTFILLRDSDATFVQKLIGFIDYSQLFLSDVVTHELLCTENVIF